MTPQHTPEKAQQSVEECSHPQIQLSANGMYCQCKICRKLLTKNRRDNNWHELERYIIPEQGMPQADPVDTEAMRKSAAYYGRVIRERNEFYDGFISGYNHRASQPAPEKQQLIEALREARKALIDLDNACQSEFPGYMGTPLQHQTQRTLDNLKVK